jgi:hypothetical protein
VWRDSHAIRERRIPVFERRVPMTLSIFNPCTDTPDQVEIADTCGEDEWTEAREARIAEVRALIDEIAETIPAVAGDGLPRAGSATRLCA